MYNPADHKVQNQPFGVGSIPLNAKTLYYDTVKLVYRQFQNVAELEAYFAIQFKTPDFEAIVNTGGTLSGSTGKITGGTNDAYWFPNGATAVLKATNIDISLYYTSAQVEVIKDDLQSQITTHVEDTNNPHLVTKTQVGLGNVDNTSDVNKPVSTAQGAAILVETSARIAADALLQPVTDNSLTTEDKTVPGSINEIRSQQIEYWDETVLITYNGSLKSFPLAFTPKKVVSVELDRSPLYAGAEYTTSNNIITLNYPLTTLVSYYLLLVKYFK